MSAKYLLLALGATSAMAGDLFPRQSNGTCPSTQQTSCQTSGSVNTCCVNSPGGLLLQVQLWDTNPSTGPTDSWTIHGLWPDNCNGGYQENCDSSRAYTNITQILNAAGDSSLVDYMNTYWISDDESNEDFWEHEWGTHGTCVSTLDPDCFSDYQPTEEVPLFFERVVSLFKTLPTYTWLSDAGITPSSSKTYSASAIQSALSSKFSGYEVYLGCSDGVISSVEYYFNVKGTLQSGTFEPTDSSSSSSCSGSVSYPPKSS